MAEGQTFRKVVLGMDDRNQSVFRDEEIPLTEAGRIGFLSAQLPAEMIQFRMSPAGFTAPWHCTGKAQWVIIVSGRMKITLRDGTFRVFSAGESFYSADVLPPGVEFDDEKHHGHTTEALGDEPLRTIFVRA